MKHSIASIAAAGLALLPIVNVARADYPIVAHRHLADPGALVHDGRVYLYCSNDDENPVEGGYSMKSIVCVSSSDLKNWTDHGPVFRVPDDASWASKSWAPAMAERNGKFYLYFGNGGSGIGVVASDSPTGPFFDPNGKLLVGWDTPGAGGEKMWLFDPYAFIDDDGQAYLYFGGNGEDNVRVIKLNEDMISVDGPAMPMFAKGFFEASWMHKYRGKYYFSYSANPQNGMRIDYLMSDSPTSGFTYAGVVADQPPNNNNNNHAGEFEFKGGWYHVYHNREVATQAGIPTTYKRNLGIEKFGYKADGTIEKVVYTRDGVTQVEPLDPFKRVEAETFEGQSGIETTAIGQGNMALSSISTGDWIRIRGVDFGDGASSFYASVAAATGGTISLRLDSPEVKPIATISITNTGGLESWSDVSTKLDSKKVKGVHDLYLTFEGASDADLFQIDWWSFER